MTTVMPDLLVTGLNVVFCGISGSRHSSGYNAYYSDPGELFWDALYRVGLTDRVLAPKEYELLLDYGIGLIDMSGIKSGLAGNGSNIEGDIKELRSKIVRFTPLITAFNGRTAAELFYRRRVSYSRQALRIGVSTAFVLSSTASDVNERWNNEHWQELAAFIRSHI